MAGEGVVNTEIRCLVPSTWYQVLRTKYLVPSTCYQVLGTKYLVPSTWYQVVGTKYLVPSTLYPGGSLGGSLGESWGTIGSQARSGDIVNSEVPRIALRSAFLEHATGATRATGETEVVARTAARTPLHTRP